MAGDDRLLFATDDEAQAEDLSRERHWIDDGDQHFTVTVVRREAEGLEGEPMWTVLARPELDDEDCQLRD
jgi:hypothetical protein